MRMKDSGPTKQKITKNTKIAKIAKITKTRTRKASAPQPMVAAIDEHIRLRAYQFFLERGGAPGDPLADWLRAERELAGERRAES